MILVGTVASWLVLLALARTQETHLRQIARTALGSLAVTLAPYVERRDIWETWDAVDRFVRGVSEPEFRVVVVTLPDGSVLAASEPRRFPTLEPLPEGWWPEPTAGALALSVDGPRAFVRHGVGPPERTTGAIRAEVDISALLDQRRHVFWALVLSNAALTLAMATGGWLLTRRMLRPLALLGRAVDSLRRGVEPAMPADAEPRSPEFRRLFRRFRAMARAVRERQALLQRLVEEERLAQLGRLASATAHEVNNPLAGLLTVVDTLRRRGDDPAVRAEALDLLERGLFHIRNVVQAMLVTWREDHRTRPLTPRAVDDLAVLIRHEVQRRRIELVWRNELRGVFEVEGGTVRQALLNLLLNACRAAPVGGRVEFGAEAEDGRLRLVVADDGPGLPEKWRRLLEDPRARRPPPAKALGLWTVARLVHRLNADVRVETGRARPEGGTRIVLEIPAQPSRRAA